MQNPNISSKQERLDILDLFDGDAYRTYNVDLAARFGSILAAILYFELANRQRYHRNAKELISIPNHGDGWFFYTREKGVSRMGMSIQEQRTALAILSKHGLVEKANFGLPCKMYFRLSTPALLKFLNFSNNISSDAESTNWDVASNKLVVQNQQTAQYIEEHQEESKEDNNTPPTPNGESATAEEREEIFSSNEKKEELSPLAKETSLRMIEVLKKHNVVYRPPKGNSLIKFNKYVGILIDKEKQDPARVLAVLEFAVQDTEISGDFPGWATVIYSKCPTEKLWNKFTTLNARMASKKKRKFAPCSDDNEALAKFKKMKETAL